MKDDSHFHVTMTITGWTAERAEVPGWVAYNKEFGIYVYADNMEAAKTRVEKAVDMTMTQLVRKGRKAVEDRLSRIDAEYAIVEPSHKPAKERFEYTERRLLPAM